MYIVITWIYHTSRIMYTRLTGILHAHLTGILHTHFAGIQYIQLTGILCGYIKEILHTHLKGIAEVILSKRKRFCTVRHGLSLFCFCLFVYFSFLLLI